MLEREVRLGNRLGLHARAAAQLVRAARNCKSEITLERLDNGQAANARSILDLLALSASCGVSLTLRADGPDEGRAIADIESLFADNFGEDQWSTR